MAPTRHHRIPRHRGLRIASPSTRLPLPYITGLPLVQIAPGQAELLEPIDWPAGYGGAPGEESGVSLFRSESKRRRPVGPGGPRVPPTVHNALKPPRRADGRGISRSP